MYEIKNRVDYTGMWKTYEYEKWWDNIKREKRKYYLLLNRNNLEIIECVWVSCGTKSIT